MFHKVNKILFIAAFIAMLVIPLFTTNMQKDKISESENRTLAQMPSLYNEDGTLNREFTSGFEAWINDNIGFRDNMVITNAKIQYSLFHVLSNNSDYYLGPKGELNYATPAILLDYQHLNLYPEEHLKNFAESLQYINDYVESKNSQLYYYQCWDKQSIYPEYFPDTVIQHGDKSKTDEIVRGIKEYSSINVISPKRKLLDSKSIYDPYSKYGDATHWSQRGAYIGYLKLMSTINENNGNKYHVLDENDYNLTVKDQGTTLFGGIHKKDMLEDFEIKNPKAVLTNEKLTLYADDQRHLFYTNRDAGNDTRLLVIGDSYFGSFLMDDIAESFYETVLIWGDYNGNIGNIIEEYDADIVIIENAERVDRTGAIINGVHAMKENSKN